MLTFLDHTPNHVFVIWICQWFNLIDQRHHIELVESLQLNCCLPTVYPTWSQGSRANFGWWKTHMKYNPPTISNLLDIKRWIQKGSFHPFNSQNSLYIPTIMGKLSAILGNSSCHHFSFWTIQGVGSGRPSWTAQTTFQTQHLVKSLAWKC